MSSNALILIAFALFASVCSADIAATRYNHPSRFTARFQRQQLSPTPYPAAGFRPDRQFPLPESTENSAEAAVPAVPALEPQSQTNSDESIANSFEQEQVLSSPDLTYGAPVTPAATSARLRQFAARQQQPQQFVPQQTYAAPQFAYAPAAAEPQAQAARLIAARSKPARLIAPKTARLTADREELDIDDAAENVDVTPKTVAAPATPQQTTFAYFPAGAVSFVHPLAAATTTTTGAYVQPAAAKLITKVPVQQATAAYIAAPVPAAATAALTQPQFYANSAFYQPQFAAYAAAPAQFNAW